MPCLAKFLTAGSKEIRTEEDTQLEGSMPTEFSSLMQPGILACNIEKKRSIVVLNLITTAVKTLRLLLYNFSAPRKWSWVSEHLGLDSIVRVKSANTIITVLQLRREGHLSTR